MYYVYTVPWLIAAMSYNPSEDNIISALPYTYFPLTYALVVIDKNVAWWAVTGVCAK